MSRLHTLLPFALLLAACGTPGEEPPLAISGMTIYEPLPGGSAAVAYFTLQNGSAAPLLLREVSSPEFRAVEMHATVVDQGVARMLALDSLTVAARSQVEFTAGGHHLMLMDPHLPPLPGDLVTLEFHYEGSPGDASQAAGVLIVDAPIQERAGGERH